MRARFNWVAELIAGTLFKNVVLNERALAKIAELNERGTVVYALRQRSLVDYLLLNYVLRKKGLPLPVFANGVTATLLAPLGEILRRLRDIIRSRARDESGPQDHDYCARAVAAGRPVLIFMRGRRTRRGLGGMQSTAETSRVGTDYLREIVHCKDGPERFVVPMALFRGHSFRHAVSTRSALVYSVQEVPSDTRKLLAYIWNRNDLFITVGTEVAVGEFVSRYSDDTEETVVKRLARAIKIFLHREERVVHGPALMPRRRIKHTVIEAPEVQTGLREVAAQRKIPVEKLQREAEGYFEEMASNFNGILFGIVAYVFKKFWGRMFSGIEQIGFEKVIEKVRDHPVVFVPCHRSHFDYLIITYLCHLKFVSPPHIFAGINMAFWPMTTMLRASGAFFVRRSFNDNEIYKLVFKSYLQFLIREGYTQEFFIEGGRSRTGKIMTPRLGMLSAIVNAQLGGIRRDLYLCPVSIHYGRIVEEDVYQRELSGDDKEAESIGGLLRARRFLKQKYGVAYVSFADPISLNEALGDRKERFSDKKRHLKAAGSDDAATDAQAGEDEPGADGEELARIEHEKIEEEKRRFIQKLGFRILRDVNDCSVAGATSVSATVLLSAQRGARVYEDYRSQANALVDLIRWQGISITASLERNVTSFRESLDFLSKNGLVHFVKRGREEVIVVRENKRLALDFYKNNLIHAFIVPSLLTFCLTAGKRREQWVDEIAWWLDLFRYEFALPSRDELAREVDRLEAYYREHGVITAEGSLDVYHPLVRVTAGVVDGFREAYWIAARTIASNMTEAGATEKVLQEMYRKDHEAARLLGETNRPEGGTVVLFRNALSRFTELGYVAVEKSGKGGRDKKVSPGPAAQDFAAFVDGLASAVLAGRLPAMGTIGRPLDDPDPGGTSEASGASDSSPRAAAGEEGR